MIISFLMKGEHGMQSGNKFYDDIIAFVQEMFQNVFKEKLVFENKHVNIEHMGCFQIRYKFLPRQYDLVFDNDRNIFDIEIIDQEGAKNLLYRIIKFESALSKENVKDAILKLQKVLEQDEFCFYINRNKKLYRKIGGEYKRVKNLNELR